MADSDFDLGSIVASSLKPEATGSGSVSVRASSSPDMDALTKIMQGVTGTVAAEAAKQKLIMQTDGDIAQARMKNLVAGAATQSAAAEAEGNLHSAQTSADYQAQQDSSATKTGAGLTMDSVLGKSIAAINAHFDSYEQNVEMARKQGDMTIGAMLRGNATFSQWYDAKFSHPASGYEEHAAMELELAKSEAARIQALQGIVTGQTAINKATEVTLYQGAQADAAKVATAKLAQLATTMQEQSMAIGADYTKTVMTESQHTQAVAHQVGTLAVSVENAKRSWAAMAAKDTDPQVLAGYVRVALKAQGRQDADMYTADYVRELRKLNPKSAAMLDDLASAGIQLVGHQAMSPDTPLPAVFGSPAETYTMLNATQGKLPTGSEQFQDRLMNLATGTDLDASGAAIKPAVQQAMINGNANKYVADVVRNTDDSEYGKPVLTNLITMASMNTPENSEFTTKVLKPLALANPQVSADMIVSAAKSSGLSDNAIITGITSYARAASAQVDAVRRPQMAGFPAAASLPYTATLTTGSLFGKKDTVNLKDEKSVRDYLFRSNMLKTHVDIVPFMSTAIDKASEAGDTK